MKKIVSLVVTVCALASFASAVIAADNMMPAAEKKAPMMEEKKMEDKKMEKKKPMKKAKKAKKTEMEMKGEGEMKKDMKEPAPAMK
jgi:hypothetical protein